MLSMTFKFPHLLFPFVIIHIFWKHTMFWETVTFQKIYCISCLWVQMQFTCKDKVDHITEIPVFSKLQFCLIKKFAYLLLSIFLENRIRNFLLGIQFKVHDKCYPSSHNVFHLSKQSSTHCVPLGTLFDR